MSQSTSNNPNTFPHLLEENLKQHVKRWIKDYSEVPFERIVLYSYSSAYPQITRKIITILYAVVFELSTDTKGIPFFIDDKNIPSQEEYYSIIKEHVGRRLDILEKEHPKESLVSFLSDIGYLSTTQTLDCFLTEDFINVYKLYSMNDNFRNDWTLIPKFINTELPASVMMKEPHWVLFDISSATAQLSNQDIRKYKTETQPHTAKTKNQRHKLACEEIAKAKWLLEPELTIPQICESPKIEKACEGKKYSKKTIANWIRKFNPNKNPGRRPKKI